MNHRAETSRGGILFLMVAQSHVFQQNLFDLQPEHPDSHSRPPGIRFGTSTWTYPGWVGLVYSRKHRDATEYLREYVRFPLFSTVGADFTFYQPPDPHTLQVWNQFLPTDFQMVFKVWDEITVDRFGKEDQLHSPHRVDGSTNPHFLDRALFEDRFLACFEAAGFRPRIAAFLFEFRSSTAGNPTRFLDRLQSFLASLPSGYPYAVEIRAPRLLGDPYFSILRSTRVSHVFNHWDRMPPLSEQMSPESFTGDRVISRILTPLKMPYAVAKKKFAPYNQLHPEDILHSMREDVVRLCLESIRQNLPGYILVNNRAEGCAPLSVRALDEMLRLALSLKEPPAQPPAPL